MSKKNRQKRKEQKELLKKPQYSLRHRDTPTACYEEICSSGSLEIIKKVYELGKNKPGILYVFDIHNDKVVFPKEEE